MAATPCPRMPEVVVVTDRQSLLTDEPADKSVAFDTSGRVIRPALELPTALVDECRLHVEADQLRLKVVDPANVGMVQMAINADAFDAYDGDAFTLGMELDTFADRVSDARLGTSTDDPVAVTLDPTMSQVTIDRDYGDTRVQRTDEWLNIDPESVRKEPELPDLDLPCVTEGLDPRAFDAAISDVARSSDHLTLSSDGDDVVFEAQGKAYDDDDDPTRATTVRLPDAVVEREDASSKFSLDYLKDMAGALKAAKVDHVRVRWGDEFPIIIEFERTDADGATMYDGTYLLAPRIQRGDDDE